MTENVELRLTDDQRAMLRAPDSRMDAYYYSFERTGNEAIDAILSAVAWAGKGWHSTSEWVGDPEEFDYGPFRGMDPERVIQAAANEAALTTRPAPAETVEPLSDQEMGEFVGGLAEFLAAPAPVGEVGREEVRDALRWMCHTVGFNADGELDGDILADAILSEFTVSRKVVS